MATLKALRERWTPDLLTETSARIEREGRTSRTLAPSPFGLTEAGLDDYRGFFLSAPLKRMNLVDVDLSNLTCVWAGNMVDCTGQGLVLTGANFSGRFLGQQFTDCDFSRAALVHTPLGETSFTDCRFTKANLRTAMAQGATFVRCFSGADLRTATLFRVTFEGCTFEGANLLHASIAGSRLVDCTFAPGAWDRSIVAHVLVNGAPMAGSAP